MIESWGVLAPAAAEVALLVAVCAILLYDAFVSEEIPYDEEDARTAGEGPARPRGTTSWLSIAAVAGAGAMVIANWPSEPLIGLGGHFIDDPLAALLKVATCVIAIVVFVYARPYVRDRRVGRGEYWILSVFGVLGVFVLASASSLLSLYLGLELLSLSLYALVAFDRDSPVAAEAAVKYFVLGALASGALLYGFSMIYGITGAIELDAIAAAVGTLEGNAQLMLLFGIAFTVVAVAFKLGAVPFHMWLPDVYHGAPTSVTLYVGTVSKLGALALALRLLHDGFAAQHAEWQGMLVALVVLSLAVGNIVAIAQTNMKRMLAYSAISHVGFILLGICAGGESGYAAALLYTLVYVLMAAGAFGIVLLLTGAGYEADELVDMAGLNERSRWFAGIMLVMMFSMAGLPPFLGFHAKVAVLQAAIEADLSWLAVFAILMSVIGAFYYLRVVKLMYFDDGAREVALRRDAPARAVLSANGLAVLLLGFFPGSLLALCLAVL